MVRRARRATGSDRRIVRYVSKGNAAKNVDERGGQKFAVCVWMESLCAVQVRHVPNVLRHITQSAEVSSHRSRRLNSTLEPSKSLDFRSHIIFYSIFGSLLRCNM